MRPAAALVNAQRVYRVITLLDALDVRLFSYLNHRARRVVTDKTGKSHKITDCSLFLA